MGILGSVRITGFNRQQQGKYGHLSDKRRRTDSRPISQRKLDLTLRAQEKKFFTAAHQEQPRKKISNAGNN